MAKGKKIKILLIEDDSFLVEMYTTKFELEGFEVVSAEDGKKGLDMVKKEKPDIILLDILMPKMDGFAVLDALKKDTAMADIPVILLTNLGQKDDVKKLTVALMREYNMTLREAEVNALKAVLGDKK